MIVELKQICKSFADSEGGATRPVLNEVDFSLNDGESVAILGASGSGKSTLLNIIGTLDNADSGEIILFGANIAGASEDELSRLRSSEIGFIFQLHHLLPQCSVLENVLVPTPGSQVWGCEGRHGTCQGTARQCWVVGARIKTASTAFGRRAPAGRRGEGHDQSTKTTSRRRAYRSPRF